MYLKNLLKYIKSGGLILVNVTTTKPEVRFSSKTVLVTGGTSGIGLGIAKQFLAEGANVIITGRKADTLASTQTTINNPRLHTLQWDMSNISIARQKIQEASSIIGPIDIVVNNAGVYASGSWNSITEEMYDTVNNTNAKGLFFMCQAEGDYFVKNNIKGRIINICSIAGLVSGFNPYSVSKWSSVCITKGIAKELVRKGIIVNGIAPGNVVTNIHSGVRGKDVNDNAYMPQHPTGRYTLVEEIAEMATYLAGGAASNIVGQVIAIDGGWSLT